MAKKGQQEGASNNEFTTSNKVSRVNKERKTAKHHHALKSANRAVVEQSNQ